MRQAAVHKALGGGSDADSDRVVVGSMEVQGSDGPQRPASARRPSTAKKRVNLEVREPPL